MNHESLQRNNDSQLQLKFKAKYYEQKLSDVSKSDTLSDDDVKILRKYGPVKSVYDCCKYVTFWFETLVNKCSFQFLKHTILDQKLALKKIMFANSSNPNPDELNENPD